MSWSFKVVGKPADVKAAVAASSAPDCVKEAVAQVCDGITNSATPPPPTINGIFTEGFGHYGPTDYWNGVTLKVEGITLAAPAPEPSLGAIIACVLILSLFGATLFTGCTTAQLAETGNIVSDTLTDAQVGLAAYADLQTSLSAAQQVMGGHGVSLNNVVTYATAEASSANTSGLVQAAQSLAVDIASQIAQGQTPAAITGQLTTAQTQLAAQAAPPAATTNAIYGPTCPFQVATTGN